MVLQSNVYSFCPKNTKLQKKKSLKQLFLIFGLKLIVSRFHNSNSKIQALAFAPHYMVHAFGGLETVRFFRINLQKKQLCGETQSLAFSWITFFHGSMVLSSILDNNIFLGTLVGFLCIFIVRVVACSLIHIVFV